MGNRGVQLIFNLPFVQYWHMGEFEVFRFMSITRRHPSTVARTGLSEAPQSTSTTFTMSRGDFTWLTSTTWIQIQCKQNFWLDYRKKIMAIIIRGTGCPNFDTNGPWRYSVHLSIPTPFTWEICLKLQVKNSQSLCSIFYPHRKFSSK